MQDRQLSERLRLNPFCPQTHQSKHKGLGIPDWLPTSIHEGFVKVSLAKAGEQGLIQHRENGFDQTNDDREQHQQSYAHEHRHEQTNATRHFLLRLGQFAHQDRDENDVVDAQHQLQHGQGGQSHPHMGVC